MDIDNQSDNQAKSRGIKIFALIVALVLVAALVYFYLQGQETAQVAASELIPTPTVAGFVAQPTPKLALPDIPAGAGSLALDEEQNQLLDANGHPVYELDSAGTDWQPVVPAELSTESGELRLMKDQAGQWVLAPQDGIARYRWDPGSLSFNKAQDIQATLPEFPETDVELKYDEVQEALVDPDGEILFRLDRENEIWVPTVPEEILKQAEAEGPTQQDNGKWVVRDPEGNELYTLVAGSMEWQAVEQPEDLPEFPTSDKELTYDEQTEWLTGPDGTEVYLLDREASLWIPVIPDDIAAGLPEGYTVQRTEDSWAITWLDGVDRYTWDASDLAWVVNQYGETAATPVPTPQPDSSRVARTCRSGLLSRLQVGDTVQTLTNLNLRSSPGIKGNYVRTHPEGTTLEIIGGPECVPFEEGAYLWWNVRHSDGTTGWSAEGSSTGRFYFLEPVD